MSSEAPVIGGMNSVNVVFIVVNGEQAETYTSSGSIGEVIRKVRQALREAGL